VPGSSAVIFDMDGVLIDSGAYHRAAWEALLAELGIPLPPEFWRRTIGRPAEDGIARLLGRTLSGAEARDLSRRKHAHYTRLAREGLPPIPGAPGFVHELARQGVPRAVATSARRSDAMTLLAHAGLLEQFRILVTADEVQNGKPEPDVYLAAARGLDVEPSRCLVFEDSLVGVLAGRAAGMRVIGLTTAHTEAELLGAGAERVIADFEGCAWPV
jgi:beta-phosphoglucomutase family hydrolase